MEFNALIDSFVEFYSSIFSYFFLRSNVFHEVIEDESPPSVTADIIEEIEEGEWNIKHEEIYFGQKIVEEPRHQICLGKF